MKMSSGSFRGSLLDSIPDYQYEDLRTPEEIRLITIVPGDFDDDIVLRIFHDVLAPPPPEPPRMSTMELEDTLPPGWELDETRDGRFMFIDKTDDTFWNTFWNHPDPTIDPSRYLPPAFDLEPRYEALSYTWGDLPDGGISGMFPVYIETSLPGSQPPENVEVGSCFAKLFVTANLAIALRHLRLDRTRTLPVWIDAISINQASLYSQVRRMTDIYRLANQVIVWLGPSSSSSGKTVAALSQLGQQYISTMTYAFVKSPDAPSVLDGEREMNPVYALFEDDTYKAIEDLLTRPWFKRLWVVQEIQLARDAFVYCGMDKIPWNWLWQAASFLYWNVRLHPLKGLDLSWARELGDKGGSIRSSTTTASIATSRLCKDPRDSVYGLMAIFPSKLRARIQPRYDKEVWEVYRDFVVEHEAYVERLEIMDWCGSFHIEECPSWVPNLQNHVGAIAFNSQFAAGFSRSWVESCEDAGVEVEKRASSLLRAKGVQCGTIIRAESLSNVSPAGLQPVAEALRALVLRKGNQDYSYVTGESMAHAAAKLLCLAKYKERYAEYEIPSLETWMQSLFPPGWQTAVVDSNSENSIWGDHPQWTPLERITAGTLANALPCILETAEGYFGFGPPDTQAGDIITAFLGCASHMLLRPNNDGETHRVVGPVYVHGLSDAITLLGLLPEPWRVQVFPDRAGLPNIFRFFNAETGELTDEDPRLDPLPDEWRRINRDRTEDDPQIFQCFENTRTGETITHDPRMSPEALIARGVDIRTFCLA
ncbi:Heterokaryon incompatibility protein (HET) domain containing protein [Naviculisporaceae sp. PSN 640]